MNFKTFIELRVAIHHHDYIEMCNVMNNVKSIFHSEK